jgi:hypothetical protein
MNVVEEIKMLKDLLDHGKITEEEFLAGKRELFSQTNSEDKAQDINVQDSSRADHAQNSPTGLKSNPERSSDSPVDEGDGPIPSVRGVAQINPDHVVASGRAIQGSVGFLVASYVSNFIGIGLIFYSLVFEVFVRIAKGRDIGDIYTDSGALVFGSLFLLLGVIFWIKYVLRLNKAGRILKTASEASGILTKKDREKKLRKYRKPNPTAIIAALVAAIIPLLRWMLHVGMITSLPNSIIMTVLAVTGGIMAFYNCKWTFLAGALNVLLGLIALIAGFRHYSSDYVWQYVENALPISLIFITASVVFIIVTLKYQKTPQHNPK